MTEDPKRFGNYAIENFIGYGASSAVFKGYDLKCKAHGVSKNVAIKFIWDREMALDELKRLEQTQSVFEICDLITYDEIPSQEIRNLIGETIDQLEQAINCPLPIREDQPVGVLILKLINGEHLIDRAIYQDEHLDPNTEWTVDFEHPEIGEKIVLKEWLTPVARDLTLIQRLEILLQLARAIDESHRRGVVHGDLNPWNLFYNPETERISIIDLGRNNFGVQGWRAHEHTQLMLEQIDSLPPETDIRLLGQWIRYLLPKKGPWNHLVERCYHQDGRKRPPLKEIIKALKGYQNPKPKKRYLTVAMFLSAALFAGIYAWQQRTPFSLDSSGFNRIAVLPYEGSATGLLVAEMVSKSLNATGDLETADFRTSKDVSESLSIVGDQDVTLLRKAANTLGVQFILAGSIKESENGNLLWTGTLFQKDGTQRKLTATGQNFLVLSDAISTICLKFLGSAEIPLPTSTFYSTDLNANFLYGYGNEFLNEGNLNAAFPMFRKAVEFDPDFHWARAKMAYCHFFRGNIDQSQEQFEQLKDLPAVVDQPQMLAFCYRYLAYIAWQRRDVPKFNQLIHEGKRVCEENDLKNDLASMLDIEATVRINRKEFDNATTVLDEAMAIYRERDDHIGQLQTLTTRVRLEMGNHNYELARKLLAEGLQLAQEYNIEHREAIILTMDARLDMVGSQPSITPETLNKLRRALNIQSRIGDVQNSLTTDYYIAYYYYQRNEMNRAEPLFKDLYRKARRTGNRYREHLAKKKLALLALMTGRNEEAELHYLELLDERNNPDVSTREAAYSALWQIYARRNEFEKATFYLQEDLDLAFEKKDRLSASYAYNNFGELYERRKKFDLAFDYYQKSLKLKYELENHTGITWTLRNLVCLSIKRKRLDEAEQYMDELMGINLEEFQTKVVRAWLHYEKGELEEAYRIMTFVREDLNQKGRWHKQLEDIYSYYTQAFNENRYIRLPEQFGNWF